MYECVCRYDWWLGSGAPTEGGRHTHTHTLAFLASTWQRQTHTHLKLNHPESAAAATAATAIELQQPARFVNANSGPITPTLTLFRRRGETRRARWKGGEEIRASSWGADGCEINRKGRGKRGRSYLRLENRDRGEEDRRDGQGGEMSSRHDSHLSSHKLCNPHRTGGLNQGNMASGANCTVKVFFFFLFTCAWISGIKSLKIRFCLRNFKRHLIHIFRFIILFLLTTSIAPQKKPISFLIPLQHCIPPSTSNALF